MSISRDTSAVSLTDLCAICHVNPIKYTCPRDGIHTCSLPCVKRHKQWAQCSGVRDPAEYRKRSELATDASIDKDFNFITKVERSISQADNVVADRGIDLTPARFRPHDTRPKIELEAEANDVKIVKAPKGLSRSKQNKTYWGSQSKCIVWTVEWIFEDGRKIMNASAETHSIKDLYEYAAGSKRSSRKRKRQANTNNSGHNPTDGMPDVLQMRTETTSEEGPAFTMAQAISPEDSKQVDAEDEASLNPESAMPVQAPELHFYLHRPDTESRFKCLIPISQSISLREALSHRTIIEYPTIYIRRQRADELQAPFITEAEYIQRHGKDIPINLTAPVEDAADVEELEDGELISASEIPPSIDELKVLEVLAKDLGS